MKTYYSLALSLVFFLFFCAVPGNGMMRVEVKEKAINGFVYKKDQRGVPGLTVRLIPTKEAAAQNKPEKVTSTDKNGKFSFTGVYKGKYLLELYEGVTLIYRDVIDTTKKTQKIIELKETAPSRSTKKVSP